MKIFKLIPILAVMVLAIACSDSGGESDNNVGDGDLTNCTSDADCPSTQICYYDGTCRVTCFDYTDCAEGEVCAVNEGICVPAETCDFDSDCPPGFWCLPDEDLGENVTTCQPPPTDGDKDGVIDGDGDSTDEFEEDLPPNCPNIKVTNTELDFGAVQTGNSATRSFEIINDSNDKIPLVIYDIFYDNIQYTDEYTLDPNGLLSEDDIVLARGESITVEAIYEPVNAGIDEAKLSIISNGCNQSSLIYVSMKSQYKGTAYIDVTPAFYDFGNVDLGSTPQYYDFNICNTGDTSGNKVLEVRDISPASGSFSNFKIIQGGVSPAQPPLMIEAGDTHCHAVKVQYSPQGLAPTYDPHRERFIISNNSDTESERFFEIDVQGHAESSSLFVHPYPIEFGTVTIGEEGEIEATLHNYSETDVTINQITTVALSEDSGCDEFSIEDPNGVQGSVLPADNGGQGVFIVKYNPVDEGEDTCHLNVSSNLPSAENMQFPIHGAGKPANIPPVALVSANSHGQTMTGYLEGVPEDTRLCFYGDISYDPDVTPENIMTPIKEHGYKWAWLEQPPNAEQAFTPIAQHPNPYMNVCYTFEIAGTYRFKLDVVDQEDLESEDPFEITVLVNGNQGLMLIMNFTPGSPSLLGESAVDCDLGLLSTAYLGVCDDEPGHITSNGSCHTMKGATCSMPVTSQGAEGTGTEEQINCNMILDGPWHIYAYLDEDCDDVNDWQTIYQCWGTHDPNVTIEGWDANDWYATVPLWTVTTKLTSKGDKDTWLWVRRGGVWEGEPQKL